MGYYPGAYTKEEFKNLFQDESVKNRIDNIPEKIYGENDSEYELQLMCTFYSFNMSYSYSISYHGIKGSKVDTAFYVGPESEITETLNKVEKHLEDFDY